MSENFNASDVRLELGSPSSAIITDVQIEKIIDQEKTFNASVARVALILYRHFSMKADRDLGDVSYKYQERADKWLKISQEFQQKSGASVKPYFGGISKSDKVTREKNKDATEPFFKRDMFGGF
ncbi:MAG: hypothetical protein ACOC40_02705 [Thermoplasmatota archaeon]